MATSEVVVTGITIWTSAVVNTFPSCSARLPRQLFRLRRHEGVSVKYDVSADGKRFLMSIDAEDEKPQFVTVMLNWGAKLPN